MRPRALLKEAVYGSAHALGLTRLSWRGFREGLTILTYHSFGPEAEHPYLNRMPVARLKSQIDYLRRNYEIVFLEEGLSRLEGLDRAHSRRPMVALTVDDGFGDNYVHLFPLARDYCLPVTIFLATDYLDSGRLPWPTRISAMTHFANVPELTAPIRLPLGTGQQRHEAGRALRGHFSRLGSAARETELTKMERRLKPCDFSPIRPLTWDRVREMQAGGVRFGSHTRLHGWLDRLKAADVEKELVYSKSRIEAETGRPCRILAYPNGNWCERVAVQAARAGYEYALTQERGVNRGQDRRPLALRRIEIPFNERIGSFACRVRGVAL